MPGGGAKTNVMKVLDDCDKGVGVSKVEASLLKAHALQ
jgi:hypothetical protein